MSRGARINTTLLLIVASLAAYGACMALNWPGHFSPDGLWQLGQGRAGVYNSWHPPIMAWLLGLAARLSPDAAAFVAIDAAIFFLSILGFATVRPAPRPIAILVLLAIAATPVVLVYQGAVLKDVLFANTAMAGFACLAWIQRLCDRPALRRLVIAKACVLFSLAALTRQTGFVVPLCGVVALVVILRVRGASGPGALAVGAVALAAMIAIVAGASLFLTRHGDGKPENHHQMQRLQAWDIAGALHRDPRLALPATHATAPDLEAYLRYNAAPRWKAATSDNIANPPDFEPLMTPRADGVGRDWARLMVTDPGLYLRVRTEVFLATLTTPKADSCPMIIIGVDSGNPEVLEMSGLKARRSDRDELAEDYASNFYDTPIFSHLAWGAVMLIGMALAVRDIWRGARGADLVAVVGLGAAALLYVAAFFVISGSCDYRYMYLVDVAAMAMLVHRAAAPRLRQAL
jgi:hypothetical protein